MRPRLFRFAWSCVSATAAALLCASLALSPELLAEAAGGGGVPVPTGRPLTSGQRAEHALNRLTFGPRPGEVAAVQHMGMEKWLEMQLHPETIDDSAFEQRLQAFPALRLSQADLMRRFPSPAMLRGSERRRGLEPQGQVEQAVYADARAAYEARREAKGTAGTKDAAGAPGVDQAGAAMVPQGAGEVQGPDEHSLQSPRQAARRELPQERAEGTGASEVEAVLALAPDARFAKLVAMTPRQMLEFRRALRGADRLQLLQGLTPEQAEGVEAMGGAPVRVVGAELLQARLLRDLYSRRQLQAVMADFWLNHFNIYARKNQNEPYLLPAFEREVILPHALGHFEDLLVATAQSPAMLTYLDNWMSIGPHSPAAARVEQIKARDPDGAPKRLPEGINENYARELMELHTLGVSGGYTQKDVVEVAKCLTGWSIDRPYQGGEFRFMDARHEPGSKVVLGRTIGPGGEKEGLEVLHLLAASPATARFLSQKLAVRFVSDAPPPSLVDRMAATYLHTDGDIGAVLRAMFHSPEFFSAAAYKAKVKTPLEFVTSAVRVSGAQVENDLALVGALNRLGMPLYGMQTPNGYSWKAEEWVSSNALVARLNLALVLSGNRLPGSHADWTALLGGAAAAKAAGPTAAARLAGDETELERLLLGSPAGPKTRAAVLEGAANPAAQQSAAREFQNEASLAGMPGVRDLEGPARPVKTTTGREAGRDVPAGAFLPESPVATAAGLLLGSPEFQRR